LLRDGCVLAVVDQRRRDLGQDAILARGADRAREMGKTALEQPASDRYVTILTVSDEGSTRGGIHGGVDGDGRQRPSFAT
jgi:hypothetical protein